MGFGFGKRTHGRKVEGFQGFFWVDIYFDEILCLDVVRCSLSLHNFLWRTLIGGPKRRPRELLAGRGLQNAKFKRCESIVTIIATTSRRLEAQNVCVSCSQEAQTHSSGRFILRQQRRAPNSGGFLQSASRWNLEQDYEQRPRILAKGRKENTRLPIKTAEGHIQQVHLPDEDGEDTDSLLDSEDEPANGVQDDIQVARAVIHTEDKVSQRQQIINAKEELARIASLINEDPEEHIGSLRKLAEIGTSSNITVKKLAIATQLAIYKDVIPGYRIRSFSEDSTKERLSREVRKLRNFEQGLLAGYQTYIKELANLAKDSRRDAPADRRSLATIALACACNLLIAVPHFNFRSEILKILIGRLSTRETDGDFVKCLETMETLFRNDEGGHASLEAVGMLTKMIKARSYRVDERVLNTFLHLRLLSEFSSKGSHQSIDKPPDNATAQGKKMKQKREFRTKKQRKVMKENKSIEKEMKEADAVVSHEERDHMQAETLKLVFATYFRILQGRISSLMGAVLEGLAKYAHLINQDFFGDVLEALKDLINHAENSTYVPAEDGAKEEDSSDATRNATRESLLCIITAFALLQGQDASAAASTLHLDLNFFITHLYRTLYPATLSADIELSAKTLRLTDPHSSATEPAKTTANKVNVQTTAALLIRSISAVLLPPLNLRAVPPNASPHSPNKSSPRQCTS